MKRPTMAALTTVALLINTNLATGQSLSADERFAMIDAVTSIAAGADRHDWARVRAAFADEVALDYTSLWGGEAATQPADDLVAQWAGFLPGFDETLHLVTNHTVTRHGDAAATMEADFQALHRIDEDHWMLAGHYTYRLSKEAGAWKVTSLTMTWTHETGDRGLVARAANRAGQSD